jgi:hypothetical protein
MLNNNSSNSNNNDKKCFFELDLPVASGNNDCERLVVFCPRTLQHSHRILDFFHHQIVKIMMMLCTCRSWCVDSIRFSKLVLVDRLLIDRI